MKVFVKNIKNKLVPVTQDFRGYSEVGEAWNDGAKKFDTFVSETKKICILKNAGEVDKKQVYAVVGVLFFEKNFKEGDKVDIKKDVNYIKPKWEN